ncbi:MAG: lipopolysaccharide biosynthesis protein [Microbacterium sp.]|uniref:lipopolysaccharide biosynthesis protein n=1 Tax=Microbacterium sp. TaxID=51671 RepID=UPI0039E2C786
MSLASRAARGGAITITAQLIKIGIMLLSTVLLARLLSPHDYGLVAMVVAIVGVGEIFRDFGLSMAALQAKELTRHQQSNLFWINAGVGAVLAIVFFAGSYLIAAFYGQPEVVQITQALAVTFFLNGLSTQFKVSINRELRFTALSVIDLLPYFLGFLIAAGIAFTLHTYWALVAQQLVIALMTLALSVILSRWWPGLPHRVPMRGLLSFGVSFAATQLVAYATRNVDSISIGRVWGNVALGYYDRAFSLLGLPINQINTPLSRVAVPVLSRKVDEPAQYVAYLRRAQLVALYVTSTLFCLLAALATPLVVLVLGEEWEFSGVLLSVLAISGVFRSLVQIVFWVYMSRGLASAQLRFYLVAQPALIVVILAGLPWGAVGVAAAQSIGYAALWAASLAWAMRVSKLKLGVLYLDALRAVGLLGVPIAVVSFLGSNAVASFGNLAQVGAGLVCAAAWLAVAWGLFPWVRNDAGSLLQFMRLALARRKT